MPTSSRNRETRRRPARTSGARASRSALWDARLGFESLEDRRLLAVTALPKSVETADLLSSATLASSAGSVSPAATVGASSVVQPAATPAATTTPGTWQTLSNAIPDPGGAQTLILLSDGSVMVQGGRNEATNRWYRLTPDSSGSYANGTWTQLASMDLERLFFPATMLKSGKVFALGGEYSGPNTDPNVLTNTGEIYDPVTDTWSSAANFPQTKFGDDPIETLPDGRILAGYILGPDTEIYDPVSNSWSQAGPKLRNDGSDEETWLQLPDGSILSYDIFSSINDGVGHAQRFVPSQNAWVDAGTLPDLLSTPDVGYELGPAFMLPDGRAFFFGANGKTAYYTPSTNTWAAGPDVPNSMTLADAPGAMMPNGHILFAASPIGTLDATGIYTFPSPTKFFEYDPVAETYTDVTPSGLDVDTNAFLFTMLALPSGQIMVTSESSVIGIYTPSGSPDDSWRPTISSVTSDGNTFTLSGTQLNGLSEAPRTATTTKWQAIIRLSS